MRNLSILCAIVAAAVITSANSPLAAPAPTPFRQCVEHAIVALDDFLSPADVIAAGVVEECRGFLKTENRTPTHIESVVAGLKQRIVPEVLRFRSTGSTTNTR